ncbi:MAG: PIN domain-containing protein [Wenzhouxiangella sp.]|jgi:predicted nucleic acid-binding protein|nr:PIN domain-containing protein [Wenzhouxiangella sp.]
MKERSFLDTNILVYTDDADAPDKSERAIELVEQAIRSKKGVISTQVLQEYFVTSTRKLGVAVETAKQRARLFARMSVIQIATSDVMAAIDLVQLHRLSYWDALIVQAARKAECGVLLTEGLQHGQVIDGVRITNPFRQ